MNRSVNFILFLFQKNPQGSVFSSCWQDRKVSLHSLATFPTAHREKTFLWQTGTENYNDLYKKKSQLMVFRVFAGAYMKICWGRVWPCGYWHPEWGILSLFRLNRKWHLHCCCHGLLAYHCCHYYTREILLPSDDSEQKAKLLAIGFQEFPFKTLLRQSWSDAGTQSKCTQM